MHSLAPALPLAIIAVLPLAARAGAPWTFEKAGGVRRSIADGRAETPDGVVPAVLRVACHSEGDGSICVALKVEETPSIPDFDFAAFEGPDAKAASEPLFSARVGGGAPLAIEARVSGRFAKDPPDAFLFEFCAPRDDASGAGALARAIASGPGEVELAIQHPAHDGRAIRARFPTDAPDGAVAETLRGCRPRPTH